MVSIKPLKKAWRPVHISDRYSSPLYYSPAFALFTLGSLILFKWHTSFPPRGLPVPEWAEWGILVTLMGLPMSLLAGLVPYALVKLHECWGSTSVQRTVLALSLLFILAAWANPNIYISPFPVFLQTAGIVGIISLFLWPAIKFMGTPHDSLKEEREALVLHNAVAALRRRGEITIEEADVANPWWSGAPELSTKLQMLPMKARWSIEREIKIERAIQKDKR